MEDVHTWGLDPVFWSYVKLTIDEIVRMAEMPNVRGAFSLNNRPVSRAEIVGRIVEVVSKHNMTMYSVDDGSGVIMCSRMKKPDGDGGIQGELGELCRVRGSLSKFRGRMEIRIAQFYIEKDPNQQVLHWLEAFQSSVEVYQQQHKL